MTHLQRIRDDLYLKLEERAKKNKRSVRAELEVILEKELLLTVPPVVVTGRVD